MMISLMVTAWRKAKRNEPLRRTIRVAAYVSVVAGVAGVFGVHKAHASLAEGTLQIGRDMLPLAEYIKEPTPMTLNGENIVLATGTSDKGVHEILNTYESFCRTSADSQGKDWADLSNKIAEKPEIASKLGGSFDMGVYRGESKSEGSLLCFMRGENSQKTLTESLQMFQQTADLGSLGKMRYVYLRKADSGRTTVFTAWTNDHFKLDSFMVDGATDAPGSDPAGIPRPPQSQRLLSAQIATKPFGAHVYRSAATEEQVRAFYDEEMSKAGWLPVGWGPGSEDIDPGKHRIYVKDGLQIALANTKDESGTLVSLGEMGTSANDAEPPIAVGVK